MTALSARTPAAGRNRCVRRRAFTLIEVLLALAIFLLAMAVFGSMIVRNGQVAAGIEQQNLATRLCQSKLHEVAAGVVPMSSDGDQPFDEEPDYTWSLEADDGPTAWIVAGDGDGQAAEVQRRRRPDPVQSDADGPRPVHRRLQRGRDAGNQFDHEQQRRAVRRAALPARRAAPRPGRPRPPPPAPTAKPASGGTPTRGM